MNFDEDDKALWDKLARDIPFTYKAQQVEETRRRQFAAIADSAEIGLYDFQGPQGVNRLFDLLKDRYVSPYPPTHPPTHTRPTVASPHSPTHPISFLYVYIGTDKHKKQGASSRSSSPSWKKTNQCKRSQGSSSIQTTRESSPFV